MEIGDRVEMTAVPETAAHGSPRGVDGGGHGVKGEAVGERWVGGGRGGGGTGSAEEEGYLLAFGETGHFGDGAGNGGGREGGRRKRDEGWEWRDGDGDLVNRRWCVW